MALLHTPTLAAIQESPVDFFKAVGVYQGHNGVAYEPRKHQVKILDKLRSGKNCYISKPRLAGLTSTLLMYAFWKAIFRSQTNVLFMTISNSMSNIARHNIEHALLHSGVRFLRDINNSILGYTETGVNFKNGSSINFVSSISNSARGIVPNIIILDEFDHYRDQNSVIYSIMPMIADGGQIILGSTPNKNSETDFFKLGFLGESFADSESLRIFYSQNRYLTYTLQNAFSFAPHTLDSAGFFEEEEELFHLIYKNWLPDKTFEGNENLIFY